MWMFSGFRLRINAKLVQDGTQASEPPNAGHSCSFHTEAIGFYPVYTVLYKIWEREGWEKLPTLGEDKNISEEFYLNYFFFSVRAN